MQGARAVRVVGNQDDGPAEPLRHVGSEHRTGGTEHAGYARVRSRSQAFSECRQDFGFGETVEEFVH